MVDGFDEPLGGAGAVGGGDDDDEGVHEAPKSDAGDGSQSEMFDADCSLYFEVVIVLGCVFVVAAVGGCDIAGGLVANGGGAAAAAAVAFYIYLKNLTNLS